MPLYRSVPDWEEWTEETEDGEGDYEPSFLLDSSTETDLLTGDGASSGD